jgi:hypothetical protein
MIEMDAQIDLPGNRCVARHCAPQSCQNVPDAGGVD